MYQNRDYRQYKPKVIGGLGEKKSNSGTQWYLQDRVYECIIAVSLSAAFRPYYAVHEKTGIRSNGK